MRDSVLVCVAKPLPDPTNSAIRPASEALVGAWGANIIDACSGAKAWVHPVCKAKQTLTVLLFAAGIFSRRETLPLV
jgi:hypothetical protein